MTRTERFFAVMPAAGTGTRVGAAVPKQYLELAGKTVVAWSALALLQADWIERVIVVVANGDARAGPALRPLQAEHGARLQILERGGPTRRDSVLAGLQALQESAGPSDWALVHDAARPFLSLASLERLRAELSDDQVGGLLAIPVADTVKRAGADTRVLATEPREGLWLAQTPQMFRYRLLLDALGKSTQVTDEAGAVEAAGHAPRLIAAERGNFKVTTADDLEAMRAQFELRQAGRKVGQTPESG